MADHDAHLHEVLDGYAKFLQDKDLALDKHHPRQAGTQAADGVVRG